MPASDEAKEYLASTKTKVLAISQGGELHRAAVTFLADMRKHEEASRLLDERYPQLAEELVAAQTLEWMFEGLVGLITFDD